MPDTDMGREPDTRRHHPRGSETPYGDRAVLVGALKNPWRSRILGELFVRPMSPSGFVADVGGEISTISRHFHWLADSGYISVAEEMTGGRRRGAVERVYGPAQIGRIGSGKWADLPLERREVWTQGAVVAYFSRIIEAIDSRTFDSEDDRHFSWDTVALDRRAWTELTARLDDLLDWLPRLEAESTRRRPRTVLVATVGLGAFCSPPYSAIQRRSVTQDA